MRLLAVPAALLLVATACGGGNAAPEASVLQTWFEQTAQAAQAAGGADPVQGRTWALAWWAADRATTGHADGAYADAAVATAVHDVLVNLVPQRRKELDEALPRGRDAAGAAAGAEQAREVLTERKDDGLLAAAVEVPYALPPAAPGVWRPTPPGFGGAAEAGAPRATPFFLTSTDQLRPEPPPALTSAVHQRDLAEVRDVGSEGSTSRTAEQTAVAQYWAGSELAVQVAVLRELLRTQGLGEVTGAHLLSVYHRATVDAALASFEAKYHYAFWRPVTELREGGLADWSPLIGTPAFPEYPSGHAVFAGAGAEVLTSLVGPGPRTPLVVGGRTFSTWQQLVTENVDARVWDGIHYRTSDEVGATLGRDVADVALGHVE
ncbi:MAG: phosphoesterase PA-phosphatase related protein [Frankiales bacterium]|nr:phosphoesterase PA-phosphatase related protein [Frankiales bacterium]